MYVRTHMAAAASHSNYPSNPKGKPSPPPPHWHENICCSSQLNE